MATRAEFMAGLPILDSELMEHSHRPPDASDLYVYRSSLRQVLHEIQAKYGVVKVDCNLFVQIAAIITGHKQDYPNFILIAPEQVSPLRITNILGPGFGYIHPEKNGVAILLQRLTYVYKGHWIYQLGPDRYVGITENGPEVKSVAEWIRSTRDGLLKEIHESREAIAPTKHDSDCAHLIEGREELEWSLLEHFLEAGFLDHWVLGPNF
jgi:hypothetical protein